MDVDEAFSLISGAIDRGLAANAYLVSGETRGNCAELAARVLKKLFPTVQGDVFSSGHPDIAVLEPQGKSRTIKIQRGKDDKGPGMRDGMLDAMSATSYSGGWKAGVVFGADRMQEEAANAFLKLLEEPPPSTMFLLLTDAPDAILPTIVSRSQRIFLPTPPDILEGADLEAVSEAFAKRDAAALAAILDGLKKAVDDSDAAFVRRRFFRTLLSFARRMLANGSLPLHAAFRNIEAVEDACRQAERSIGEEAAISFMLDRIAFPA